jgi:putative transposase
VAYRRRPLFANAERVEQLRQSFRYAKTQRPYDIIAAVILPDHLHCLWQLPDGDHSFSARWQIVKTDFSRRIPATIRQNGSKTVWQPRFWEHYIRNDEDLRKHLDYIHYNPVKHGLVSAPCHWPYSSFSRFVQMGWYEKAWGTNEPPNLANMEYE